MELSFYLIYFMVSLPLSAHMFRHMVPSRQLINDKAYGYYIALLPILIASIQIPISMDEGLWTMDKLLSRLISFTISGPSTAMWPCRPGIWKRRSF